MAERMVQVENVSKKYGSKAALRDVSLDLPRGQVIGLIGQNGSGKSTLLRLLAGLSRPSAGRVLISGRDAIRGVQKEVAYLADGDVLYPFYTVDETLSWYNAIYSDFDPDKAREMAAFLELDGRQRVGKLSKGQYARMKIVLVCARRTPVIIMDEPLSGLDPVVRSQIIKGLISYLNVGEQTVVLSTHEVDEVEPLLDQVIVLHEGRIVAFDHVENVREQHGKRLGAWLTDLISKS